MINMQDYEVDGRLDWNAYKKAQKDNGECCCQCGAYINKGKLEEYILVDMHRFRSSGLLESPDGSKWTRDKSAQFAWWDWTTLQDSRCIVEGCKFPNSPICFWVVIDYVSRGVV